MNILVIDVGGTNVKLLATGQEKPRKFASGRGLTPDRLVEGVRENTADWNYEVVTLGYPGPVVHDRILLEPVNLAKGWVGYDFAAKLGRPVRLINDAAMQALGSYEGGRMLFLGLGTGLGTTLIVDGTVVALEMGHLPYRKGKSFEEYVGEAGMLRLGEKKWERVVHDVVRRLKAAMVADYVVLGGGNVKRLEELPEGCRQGSNKNAFKGGFRVWEDEGLGTHLS